MLLNNNFFTNKTLDELFGGIISMVSLKEVKNEREGRVGQVKEVIKLITVFIGGPEELGAGWLKGITVIIHELFHF